MLMSNSWIVYLFEHVRLMRKAPHRPHDLTGLVSFCQSGKNQWQKPVITARQKPCGKNGKNWQKLLRLEIYA